MSGCYLTSLSTMPHVNVHSVVSGVRFIDETVGAVGEEIRDATNSLVASSGGTIEEKFRWASGGRLESKFTIHHDDAITRDG